MRFAPVNPADLLMIDGRYAHQPSLPCALGAEGAGRVVAIGRGVERLAVGDDVIPLLRGNWASHRLLAEDRLVRVPPALSPMQAAMLRIQSRHRGPAGRPRRPPARRDGWCRTAHAGRSAATRRRSRGARRAGC
ncbi:MAG: alcohol dehydrogenase catalytic domain-containing protein [Sphingomonas sp.]